MKHGVKQGIKCQHINCHDTTNHSSHLSWLELLWSCNTYMLQTGMYSQNIAKLLTHPNEKEK